MLSVCTGYHFRHQKPEAGFTLIELSIVLVIIGLIVGGILTGQDLIKAAEQRATVSQIEKYNTAVNVFRLKFGGIPGDLNAITAKNFGIDGGIGGGFAGTTGIGDGNGLIESAGGNAGGEWFTGETPIFWLEISQAGLVDGSFCPIADINATTGIVAQTSASIPISTYMPAAKLGRGNYITAGSVPATAANYFVIGGFSSIAVDGRYGGTDNLTGMESYNMDKKIDDGLPVSGYVQALNTNNATGTPLDHNNGMNIAPVLANCVTGAPLAYNLTSGTPACSLRFQFR